MSESFNKCCPWGFVLLGIVLAAPPPLSAQQIDQGPAIDVEEYDISVQLRPSKQELQAVATVKFTASQERLGRVFLDFNGNLTVNRVYFADRPPAPGSLSKGSSPGPVASGRDTDRTTDRHGQGRRGAPPDAANPGPKALFGAWPSCSGAGRSRSESARFSAGFQPAPAGGPVLPVDRVGAVRFPGD